MLDDLSISKMENKIELLRPQKHFSKVVVVAIHHTVGMNYRE